MRQGNTIIETKRILPSKMHAIITYCGTCDKQITHFIRMEGMKKLYICMRCKGVKESYIVE